MNNTYKHDAKLRMMEDGISEKTATILTRIVDHIEYITGVSTTDALFVALSITLGYEYEQYYVEAVDECILLISAKVFEKTREELLRMVSDYERE